MTATRETPREAPPTPETADIAGLVAFANEAAAYFEKRYTGNEDIAHWANVYNAENCRQLATALQSLSAELAEARREVEGVESLMIAQNGIVNQVWDILGREGDQNLVRRVQALTTRATTAEAQARAMREALEQIARRWRAFARATNELRNADISGEPERMQKAGNSLEAKRANLERAVYSGIRALGGTNAE